MHLYNVFGGNRIHVLINIRVQRIIFLEAYLLPVKRFFNFGKRKVTGKKVGRIGRLEHYMNLFFFQKSTHNLLFMCWGIVMRKLNVANFRLWSFPFVMPFNYLQDITFVYMPGDILIGLLE